MKRMHHVNGTKERPPGRQCCSFRLAGYGPVLVDRIHPDDIDEMFARLWGHYGKGNVWVEYRTMHPGEEYYQLDLPNEAA